MPLQLAYLERVAPCFPASLKFSSCPYRCKEYIQQNLLGEFTFLYRISTRVGICCMGETECFPIGTHPALQDFVLVTLDGEFELFETIWSEAVT